MSNTKLIAKNTIFLYIRMLLTMGVTLFTSRIVLEVLGIEDFGIYTLVGGIVSLFSFFNSAMTSATQRFLTFDIGNNNLLQLKKTFNATLNIHIVIALVFFLLAETIGVWFVNSKLNINVDRMAAVNWVYQFSVISFIVGIVQVPYDALIISNEKMNVYAYMSILEVSIKLILVYLLILFNIDKLILYSFLLFLVSFFSSMAHKIYCKIHFKETKYEFHYDKELYRKLISFSGWSLFGNIAGVARGQGLNVLLNVFFGTLLNAAYGITLQVQSAVQIFVSNFQLAVNPQIIKQYALGNNEKSLNLIFQSSKFSYFLMLIISCPVIYNIDFILNLWLKTPPIYTSSFVILSLINILIDSISGPLVTGAQATGFIKWYQITVGILIFLSLPISYLILKENNNPLTIFIVVIIINTLALFGRLFFLKYLMNLNLKSFFLKVLLKIILISTITIVSVIIFPISLESQIINFFVKSLFITIINIVSIYFIGLSKGEKNFILDFLKRKV